MVSGANRPGPGAGTAGPGSIVDDGNFRDSSGGDHRPRRYDQGASNVATEECLMCGCLWFVTLLLVALPAFAQAQGAPLRGHVTDETGGGLPGVTVELRGQAGTPAETITDAGGDYAFAGIPPCPCQLTFSLINFASITQRGLTIAPNASAAVNKVMHLALNADVVVIGKRTFANLADVQDPAEDLVGIAQSASQGAITSRQLDVRPFMRQAEVLETVPGVIITQHSGEGKANQYFLRGFNLDHGSDFAMTVNGAPVNMVTHAHSQGYSDLNFLIPELVAGVQYSKGPYYAELGDFATAGSANMNYATQLDRPLLHLEGGNFGFSRGLFAASPRVGDGHLLVAFETSRNNGPWDRPDEYRKLNGVVRYSRGNNVNGLSLTVMAYRGEWNATQAVPRRAVDAGAIDRFGTIDPTDKGQQPSRERRRRMATRQGLDPEQGSGLRYRLRPDAPQQFHVLSGRSGARRPESAGRSAVHLRRESVSEAADAVGRPQRAEHARHPGAH